MRKQTDSFKVHKISTMEETRKRGIKNVWGLVWAIVCGWVLGIRPSSYLGGDKVFVLYSHTKACFEGLLLYTILNNAVVLLTHYNLVYLFYYYYYYYYYY
jgi:hypothetical protein